MTPFAPKYSLRMPLRYKVSSIRGYQAVCTSWPYQLLLMCFQPVQIYSFQFGAYGATVFRQLRNSLISLQCGLEIYHKYIPSN